MSEFKHLYLHDDNVPPMIGDKTISIKNDDDAPRLIQGHKIGQITKKSVGWIEPELHSAIAEATREITAFIKQHFLNLSAMAPWRDNQELLTVMVASECLYINVQRPERIPRITIRPAEISQEWPRKINHAQTVFEIGSGFISTGGPDGGSIQIPYKLRT